MENSTTKALSFKGTPGGFFVAWLVLVLLMYVPVVGWAFGFNYFAKWVAENSEVNGRKVVFTATFGETFTFVLVNILLIVITLGIYMFWYAPKMYSFIADHVAYADAVPSQAAAPMPQQPVMPATPTMPTPPTSPVV